MTQSSPNKSELVALLDFAGNLADIAAEVTLRSFRQLHDVENKLNDGRFDPVTVADREAERVMRAAIEEKYPTHGIVGEEHGKKIATDNLSWVLDPIDGTRAFISGIPVWGTLIALNDGVEPILGVMDQPFTKERFVADNETSFCLHGNSEQILSTRDCGPLGNATLMSTAPDMFDSEEFRVQQALADQVKLMRYGGDCYAYCMLASGHVDLVVEASLAPYDIQALIPIVRSAGGIVTDWLGGSAANGGQVVAAATPELHAQAMSVLEPAARKSDTIL